MTRIIRTDSRSPDFRNLVESLDAELAERDGSEHSFYAQFNTIDSITYAVVAYENEMPAGCGAIKPFAEKTMEIKRMFVASGYRRMGIAALILSELERWAAELSAERCVLETGKRQPEAVALYEKNGYRLISNYGQYADVGNSLCFEKLLEG